MSILSRWFRRLKNRKRRRREVHREYMEVPEESYYGVVDSIDDPLSIKNHVVHICEQMIDISREIDDVRQEYERVTAYLNDIQIVEGLEGEQRKQLEEVATKITKLVKTRNDYLNAEQKISDETFNQMEEMEAEIPNVIRRLKVNEADLETVKHDLNYLAAEKVEWSIIHQEREEEIALLRKHSITILFAFGGIAVYDGYSSDLSKTGDIVCSTGSSAGILFYGDTITYADGTVEQVEYEILPYPVFENGSKTAIQRGGGLMVAKTDEKKEYAACEFIKWLTAAEQNMKFVDETGYLPVTKKAFEDDMESHIETIENEKVKMMLTSVMSMYDSYTFFSAPTYSALDADSDAFETKLYDILSTDRDAFGKGETLSKEDALDKLRK